MTIPRKTACIIFTILAAAAALISITALSSRYAEIEKLSKANALSTIDDRLKGAFAAINDFPGSAAKDILFLKTLSREEDIHRFLSGNNVYRDVYVFGAVGDCTARISAGDGVKTSCETVPDIVRTHREQLEDLAPDAVHISSIELYEDVPVLLYGTSHNEGYVVSVIDANYFLEEIRRLTRDGEGVYLLSRDGSYLAHPDSGKEKLFGGEDGFYRDFADVPGGALDDPEIRRFESDSHIYTFWRMYPSVSNFALYEGASALYGKEHADEDYWVMAAVSEKPSARRWWQEPSFLMTAGLIVFLHVFLITLAYALAHHKALNYE